MDAKILTQELVRQLFNYDPDTGLLTWLVSRGTIKAGRVAGTAHTNGRGCHYVLVGIGGSIYRAHRIIWLWQVGAFPSAQIDHIDGDGLNNRWANLRDIPASENAKNQSLRRGSLSGVPGVIWSKPHKKWKVQVSINGERKYLGLYVSLDEAVAARLEANIKYDFHPNHGHAKPLASTGS